MAIPQLIYLSLLADAVASSLPDYTPASAPHLPRLLAAPRRSPALEPAAVSSPPPCHVVAVPFLPVLAATPLPRLLPYCKLYYSPRRSPRTMPEITRPRRSLAGPCHARLLVASSLPGKETSSR